ncbi:hypothetical protein [Sphingomonas endolithica]|uniref:hypothetical protein n=1 Tax=Sphingomonas endolithica TaxID=2972485 RepID=UPI0021AE32E6|nr:hypothetical protein [Sphingomonas sp. ZFBP2030]
MTTQFPPTTTPTRPEDVLADGADRTEIDGMTVRKGTVAAFLQNAMKWSDPSTADPERDALGREITKSVSALKVLGVFDVFEVRDERLRALMESC